MPLKLYYFHSQTDRRFADTVGKELKGSAEAQREAILACGKMMHDPPESFWGSRPWSNTVTDRVGLVFWELSVDGFQSPAGDH